MVFYILIFISTLLTSVIARLPWEEQLLTTESVLCKRDTVIDIRRELANSGFHKDLTTHIELQTEAFILENITSDYYIDLDQIREGLYLGYPPVFADRPIDVEQPADKSPHHVVGLLYSGHHVTIPVHHRYQPAGQDYHSEVCLLPPRLFLPVITMENSNDIELDISEYEKKAGCRLLRAPCGIKSLPECGWEEVGVLQDPAQVCSTVPIGVLQHLTIVQVSTAGAVLLGLFMILYTVFTTPDASSKEDKDK